MNIRLKIITFLSLIGLSSAVAAMDAEQKKEAAATYPKQRIEAVLEAALIKSDILPKVLAPLIAEYAEPVHEGYLFLVPTRPAKACQFVEGFLEKYQQDFPELGHGLTQESVLLDTWVSSRPACLDGSDPKPWHAHQCPHLPEEEGMNWPHDLPAHLLKDLKEGDTLQIRVRGVLFALKCSQLTHRNRFDPAGQPRPFEKLFAQATAGLLPEPNQQRADEETED